MVTQAKKLLGNDVFRWLVSALTGAALGAVAMMYSFGIYSERVDSNAARSTANTAALQVSTAALQGLTILSNSEANARREVDLEIKNALTEVNRQLRVQSELLAEHTAMLRAHEAEIARMKDRSSRR